MSHPTNTPVIRKLKERLSFNLTYKRSAEAREISCGYISGSNTDDAYNNGESPGGWSLDTIWPTDQSSSEEWLLHFLSMAVGEAVHEALEWFQMDGRSVLDPHVQDGSDLNYEVIRLVDDLSRKLFALRECRRP